MSKKSVFCFAMLLSAVSISSANAHGVWVEERHGQFEAVYGDGPQIDSYKAEKFLVLINGRGTKKQMPVLIHKKNMWLSWQIMQK